MASFQAKTGWKRLKKRENNNYRFVSFLLDGQQKIPTKQQKYSENSKIPLWFHLMPKQVEKRMRKRENKNFCSVQFLTRNRNFQKNSKIIQKIQTYRYGFISGQNSLEKVEKERK